MITNNRESKIKVIDLYKEFNKRNLSTKQVDYIIKHDKIDFKIYNNKSQLNGEAMDFLKENFYEALTSPEFINNYFNFINNKLANVSFNMSNFVFPFNSLLLGEVQKNIDSILKLKEKEEINYNDFFMVIMNLLSTINDNAANYDYRDSSKLLALLFSIYKFKDNKVSLKKYIIDICNNDANSSEGYNNKILVQYKIILFMTALFYHISLPQDTILKLFNFISLSQKNVYFTLYNKNSELTKRICSGLIKELNKFIKLINKASYNDDGNGSLLINQAASFVDHLLKYYDEDNCFSELTISNKITTLIVLVIFYARLSKDYLANSFRSFIDEIMNELDKDLIEYRFDGLLKNGLKSNQTKKVISSIQDDLSLTYKLMEEDSIKRLITYMHSHKSFIILLLITPHINDNYYGATKYMFSKEKLLHALPSFRSFKDFDKDELIKIFGGIEYSNCIFKYNKIIKNDDIINYYFDDYELPDELINEYYDSMKVIPELNKLLVELDKTMEAKINGTKYYN